MKIVQLKGLLDILDCCNGNCPEFIGIYAMGANFV